MITKTSHSGRTKEKPASTRGKAKSRKNRTPEDPATKSRTTTAQGRKSRKASSPHPSKAIPTSKRTREASKHARESQIEEKQDARRPNNQKTNHYSARAGPKESKSLEPPSFQSNPHIHATPPGLTSFSRQEYVTRPFLPQRPVPRTSSLPRTCSKEVFRSQRMEQYSKSSSCVKPLQF
jgi:hypothetical protein